MTLPEFFRCIGVVHAQVKLWVAAKTGLKGLKLDAALDDLYAGLVTTAQNKPSLKPIKETKELKQ
jgi:hypothetical protein